MGINATGVLHKGYGGADEIPDYLKNVLHDYQQHETASLEFARIWREKHSAKRLTKMLVESGRIQ